VSAVREHGSPLARRGRWLPLSFFNLDNELGYDQDMLAGLQVRRRGLTDALIEEGLLTLPGRMQDLVDAIYWERLSYRQAGRRLEGIPEPVDRPTLRQLVWEQYRDDPIGTLRFGLPKPPRPKARPAPPYNGPSTASLHRQMREAYRHLAAWCLKWVEGQLTDYEEEAEAA